MNYRWYKAVTHLAVPLQVFANGNGLLDHVIKIFGNFGSQPFGLENSQNFGPGYELDLSHSVGVTQNDADLRRRQTWTRRRMM